MQRFLSSFDIEKHRLPYSSFVPRFYNLCKSYGFRSGKITPSRAFCSDENQGVPILYITKHFAAFPFNHGQTGGVVATSRHGPHAHHGEDLAIIQASHVGYDPDSGTFGHFRRAQLTDHEATTDCGLLCAINTWYEEAYRSAQAKILFAIVEGEKAVIIDNQLLSKGQAEGVRPIVERLCKTTPHDTPKPLKLLSTAKAFAIHPALAEKLPAGCWSKDTETPIGKHLSGDLFQFRRTPVKERGGTHTIEDRLVPYMPYIVTAKYPALAAAQATTLIEFDRAYRSILNEKTYQGRNLIFIAGLNIDISPPTGELTHQTLYAPWAAYIQTESGDSKVVEQAELMQMLLLQDQENPDQIELEPLLTSTQTTHVPKVKISV